MSDRILLPRLGAHLRIWGSGHSCQGDHGLDVNCVCDCGVPAPYDDTGGARDE